MTLGPLQLIVEDVLEATADMLDVLVLDEDGLDEPIEVFAIVLFGG